MEEGLAACSTTYRGNRKYIFRIIFNKCWRDIIMKNNYIFDIIVDVDTYVFMFIRIKFREDT